MKTAKKITALLIVLTLLFALSATAFAFNSETQYRIKFFVNGTEQNSWEAIGNVGESVYTAIINKHGNNAHFNNIIGTSNYALNGMYNTYSNPSSTAPAAYPSATAVPGHTGYFLIETGDDGYHYVYAGYDWTYHFEGGSDLWLYMNQCFPAANDVIEVVYSLQVTDWWSEDPIT